MNKKHILAILILILSLPAFGQHLGRKNAAVEDSFMKFLISKVFRGENLNYDTLFSTPKNQAEMFVFAASFDNHGRIDAVYFPKILSGRLLKIIHSKSALSQFILKEGFIDKNLSGKVVIQPVLMKRAGDDLVQFDSHFVKGFTEPWPELTGEAKTKPIALKDPYLHVYFQPVN